MDRELLAQALATLPSNWRRKGAVHREADDLIAWMQEHCEHWWAFFTESIERDGTVLCPEFCGKCGKEMP